MISYIRVFFVLFFIIKSSLFKSQDLNFTLGDFQTMLRSNNTDFITKYPGLTLIADIPYFHRDYVVNIFYLIPKLNNTPVHNDSILECNSGIGLIGFKAKAKLNEKRILYQTSDKEKVLTFEEELVNQNYQLKEVVNERMFLIKKYNLRKFWVHIILYSLKKKVEMGSCYRIFMYNE